MGVIIGQLGYTSVGSAQYQALRTKLAGIAAEESEMVYTLEDLLLEEVKEALSTDLEA